MKHIVLFLSISLLVFLPSEVLATGPPADWWGMVDISDMKNSNGAIVYAYVNGTLSSTSVVGVLKSDYYLIHVEGKNGDLVSFKVNGFDVSQESQVWSVGDHPELNFTVIMPSSANYTYTNITAMQCETIQIHNVDVALDITFGQNISNETFTIKKSETNPTNKSAYALESLNKFVFLNSEQIANFMDFAILKIFYDAGELRSKNIDEPSLKITYWNETEGNWTIMDSHINNVESYVWVNITHFSLYGLFGSEMQTIIPDVHQETYDGSSGGGGGGNPPSLPDVVTDVNNTPNITNTIIDVLEDTTVTKTLPEGNKTYSQSKKEDTPTGLLVYSHSKIVGVFLILILLIVLGLKFSRKH